MSWFPFELRFTEDDRAFLQKRVALYAQIGFGIVGTFLVLDVVSFPLVAPRLELGLDREALAALQLRGTLIEAGIALVLLAATFVVRRGAPGVPSLYAFDGLITLLVGGGFSVLLYQTPEVSIPFELHVFLAIQMVLFAHAVVVPAPPLRTLLVHVAACGPLLWVGFERAEARVDASLIERGASFWGLVVWTLAFAAVGALVSWVVFGLRIRVREALRLGQYRLEAKLGEGAMGVVYRAQHGMLRRPTAVKLLPPDRAGEATIQRFEREVRNTSRLTHPNTVAIYDFGRTPEGVFYYAMELLDGLDLGRVVALDGPLPPGRVVHVLRQCAGALGEAHDLGLVHRDVKPDNVVLCRRGGVPDVVKVVDFGLVKDLETPRDANLSRADVLTGTPLYMPPEAISDPDTLDGRGDLYSLGAVAWFLLVGRPPFEGATIVEVCAKHLTEAPSPPSAAAEQPVPSDLEAIVLRLLAKAPGDRFQSAADLDDALGACASASTWSRRDAERWWRVHDAALPGATPLAPDRTGTLTVAITERS